MGMAARSMVQKNGRWALRAFSNSNGVGCFLPRFIESKLLGMRWRCLKKAVAFYLSDSIKMKQLLAKTGLLVGCILAILCPVHGSSTAPELRSIAVEVHEVHELVFVLFVLAEGWRQDPNLIDTSTAYFLEVKSYFAPFKKHALVSKWRKNLATTHYHLQMDAANYRFNAQERLVKKEDYDHLSWGTSDRLQKYLPALEDFALQSRFRQFYRDHLDHYQSLLDLMQQQASLYSSLNWLEEHFPRRYAHARVIFSPLGYGKHATNYQLRDLVIWVSGPSQSPSLSPQSNSLATERMLFTELDHNYVNPVSDAFLADIDRSMRHRSVWANRNKVRGYGSSYALFNEYMTWAVYLLYAHDKHGEKLAGEIAQRVVRQMAEYRGFVQFEAFYATLLGMYLEQGSQVQLVDLYPAMLAWCAQHEKTLFRPAVFLGPLR